MKTGYILAFLVAFLLLPLAYSVMSILGHEVDLPGRSALLCSLIVSLLLVLRIREMEAELRELRQRWTSSETDD